MKIISGQYRSLATLPKWLKALLAIKSSNTSKIPHLFQSISLHIWKDIRHKPHRVIDDWLEQINDNSLTGACLLDISKCFDFINHEILLKKLEMYGITGNELDWFSSYLKNRKQMVFFQQDSSDFQEV